MACVLTALIRMNQHLFFGITPPYSHQQCVQDNVLCHPTEQANRPATGVVTDKGVPQSDSFAKYAAVDSIGQRNSYVKTWGCGGFLNETNIYSRGKSL
ncbi:hypothetical protein L3W99_22140, partial [Escherichia coli]|uniref:hypothetical protein n=1 Tax=Escherichia coli TaxID=562 RepID=UPI001F2E80E7